MVKGGEGIVAKPADAPYIAGRHDRWLKIKNRDYSRQERRLAGEDDERTSRCLV